MSHDILCKGGFTFVVPFDMSIPEGWTVKAPTAFGHDGVTFSDAASIEAGKVVTLDSVSTIADGTAVKTPGSRIFPYIQKNIDRIITVKDEELIVAFLDMVENHKMVVENSGLLSVAALVLSP